MDPSGVSSEDSQKGVHSVGPQKGLSSGELVSGNPSHENSPQKVSIPLTPPNIERQQEDHSFEIQTLPLTDEEKRIYLEIFNEFVLPMNAFY
jgi:hypothetical protein